MAKLVLNSAIHSKLVTMIGHLLDGNDRETRYCDMTDNAASDLLSEWSTMARDRNYIDIIGEVTVAMQLTNAAIDYTTDDAPEAADRIRVWSKETLDTLVEFEMNELDEGIEVGA